MNEITKLNRTMTSFFFFGYILSGGGGFETWTSLLQTSRNAIWPKRLLANVMRNLEVIASSLFFIYLCSASRPRFRCKTEPPEIKNLRYFSYAFKWETSILW